MPQEPPTAEIVTRQDAIAKGLRWYFTGKPCKHGHVAKRNVTNTECRRCNDVRATKRRAENPEPFRARDRARQDDRRREQNRASWWKHREKRLAEDKARYDADPAPKIAAAQRSYLRKKAKRHAEG